MSKSKQKIAQVIDHMGLGGAERIALGIGESFNCPILVLSGKKEMDDGKNEIIYLHGSKIGLGSVLKVLKYVRNNNIEILHTHLFKSFAAGYLTKLLIGKRLKLIIHDHGEILNKKNFPWSFIYRLALILFSWLGDQYLVVSEYSYEELIKYVPKRKVKILYNFINNEFYLEKEKKDFNKNVLSIGFAARITKKKGIIEFIEAISILRNKYPQIKAYIAGDGDYTGEMKQRIGELNLQNNIEYLGLVYNMVSFYSKLSIFINPSYYESMGLTHIEAMAMGVPCIISNVPAMNMMMENGGQCLFFEKGNVDDMVQQTVRIIEDPDLRSNIINNGFEFSNKFRIKEYTEKLSKIYFKQQ